MASIPKAVVCILFSTIVLYLCGLCYGQRLYGARRRFFRHQSSYNRFMRQTAMVYEKAKVETLGDIFKRYVQQLRQTRNRQVELVFLVDSSGTVGRHYFFEEIRFVRNLLSDFTVDEHSTRVSVITFSSPHKVFTPVDYLSKPSADNHKCRLLGEDVPRVRYTPGGTYTRGALLEAEKVLRHARPDAVRAIFLMTDGYSNGGDPRPVAARLKREGVKIFTFGIRDGFVWELRSMASEPKNETCYILDSFEEFEGLAKRALHADLESGTYLEQTRGKCRQLCTDELLCCHPNASCACGTYTGKYECLCQPGYYGTGRGVTGCQPCPYGTYKNATGYGDVTSCTRCPDEHQITPLGAVSEQQCVCKRGYRQFGSNECTVFRCPKLSPPKHGYFVNNKCHNVFNAACGLRCDPGYELRGSSLRMCRDDGTWSGSDAICIMKTCPSLSPPKNGHMVCSSDDFSYSTTCRFTCDAGYKLVNSRKRDCLAISEWTGIPPRCIGITCPPLVEIRDGKIRPVTCTSQEAIFGSTCHITCSAGYTLQGPHTRQCSPDGIWIAAEEGSSKCVDQQAPLLNCPEDMLVEADQFEETTQVIWNAPVAVDNSGLRPVLTSEPAVSPGSRFPQGVTTIRYLAEDLSQNVATCHFTITVVDKSPPRIDSCESPSAVLSVQDGIAVNFSQPVFSDNSGRSVEVAASHKPGDIFYYGKTSVVFQAFDMWNNNVTCTIVVEVVPHLCVPPEAPANGNITCEESFMGVSCSVTCLPGFASVSQTPNKYVCAFSEGIWEPSEQFPFPDCAVTQKSSDVMQPATITLEGDVNCQETQVLYQVKQLLENKVQSELANVCANEASCSLEYLQILCEDKEDSSTRQPDTTPRKGRRRRRSLPEQTSPLDGTSLAPRKSRVSFKVMLEGQWSARNKSESDVTRNLQKVLSALVEEARQGQLDLSLDFAHIDYDPDERMLRCPNGSVAVNQSCVNCPMGTFYNATSITCVACSRGSFQPQEGQNVCLICPEGTFTMNSQAKSQADCKAYCPPGTFSSSGLEPCQSCALGFYQEEQSAQVCHQCGPGTTTYRRGSRSIKECAEPCPAGHVSETGLGPCFRCPHHSYQPAKGRTQCLLCPPGLVTLSSGAVSVKSCLASSVDSGSQSDSQYRFHDIMLRDLGVLDYDACFSQPCTNGGQCVPEKGGTLFICTCPKGFVGSQCEQRVDLCELEPCMNEGQCLQDSSTFQCLCKEGFKGQKCEINFNDCESSPCQNEAECVDGTNSFTCQCPLGYYGPTCGDVTNHCTQDTCRNGGNCSNTPTGFQCACALGFNGTSCEIDEDECQAAPCQNEATCWDMPGGYRCECKQGYTGFNCETEVDECADTPCQNKAKCQDLVGSYLCQCPEGFSGDKCEKELSAHYQLNFVSPTIMEYARLTISRPLPAMSVSVWFRTSDDQNQGTIFSYGVPGQPDTLTLTNYANLNMVINGQLARIGARLNDGAWHHFVFTWSSVGGKWKAYSDGIVMDQNTDLSKDKDIPGQGIFIVGQEQDTLGGGFSPAETFVGSLTHLNVWDRVLTLQEVEQLRFSCDYIAGNVMPWISVQEHLHGNIFPQPTSFCQGASSTGDFSSEKESFNMMRYPWYYYTQMYRPSQQAWH